MDNKIVMETKIEDQIDTFFLVGSDLIWFSRAGYDSVT